MIGEIEFDHHGIIVRRVEVRLNAHYVWSAFRGWLSPDNVTSSRVYMRRDGKRIRLACRRKPGDLEVMQADYQRRAGKDA